MRIGAKILVMLAILALVAVPLAACEGEQGPSGPAGQTGATGTQGESGSSGPPPRPGEEGAAGAAGEAGVAGPAGPEGPRGEQGPMGIPGSPGTIPFDVTVQGWLQVNGATTLGSGGDCAGDTLTVEGDATFNCDVTLGSSTTDTIQFRGTIIDNSPAMVFAGPPGDAFTTSFAIADQTANQIITFPDASGEVSLLAQTISSDELDSTTGTGTVVVLNDTPTILTPTIASFTNATHDHLDAAGGGVLDTAAITTGTFDDDRISQSSVTQHEAALTILESQITDGAILARVAGNETISGDWTFTGTTNAVIGVAAGYAIARGTESVTAGANVNIVTGLTTVEECVLTVESSTAPGLTWLAVSWADGGAPGEINIYVWEPTAAGNCTLIAASATITVSWIAIGTE